MLKKILSLFTIGIISISLVACSGETSQQSASGNDQTKEQQKDNSNKGTVYEVKGATTEDSNIIQTIKEVGVFDNMTDAVNSYGQSDLVINDENKDKMTVVVKFEIQNKNDFPINTYPCQAKLITNTGEQVEADIIASESFDGEIFEGVTQEGYVLFNLDKTKIDELKSFKMAWHTDHENGTSDNYDDDYSKENKLEVNLK